MQIGNTKYAFTLVELIVVVTIIAILATIGFVSYSGYTANSRDSSRMSQITAISNAIQIYSNGNKIPLPDSSVSITGSGEILTYQGEAGEGVLEIIGYSNGGKDPKDQTYFTYSISGDRTQHELLAFLEQSDSVIAGVVFPQVGAASYENRYPYAYGRIVGILLDNVTKNPINTITSIASSGEIDISESPMNFSLYINGNENYSGTGGFVEKIIQYNKVKNKKVLGYYDITPDNANDFGVSTYVCDGRVGKYFVLDILDLFGEYAKNNGMEESDVRSWYGLIPVTPGISPMTIDDLEYNGAQSGIVVAYCETEAAPTANDNFYIIRSNGNVYYFDQV